MNKEITTNGKTEIYSNSYENGEQFVGFGTYKIEVLSRYLREYFFEDKEIR